MASLRALHLERKWSKRRERRRGETFEKGKLILLWFAGGLKKIKQLGAHFFSLQEVFLGWTWRFGVKVHATLVSLMEKVVVTW